MFRRWLGVVLWSAAIAVLAVPCPAAAMRAAFGYSGRLLEASGDPANGRFEMSFRLYDAEAAGELLFEETFTAPFDVEVTSGYFFALLANNEAGALGLDAISALHDDLYLELEIEGEVLVPRQTLAPVPWALSAKAGGGGGGDDTLGALLCPDGYTVQSFSGAWDCSDDVAVTGAKIGEQVAGKLCSSDGTSITCTIDPSGAGTESDPVFGASPAASVTNEQMGEWSTAYAWGDHHAGNYLTQETDPQIGSLTSGRWCTTNGTTINCTDTAPVLSEIDPKVGTLNAGGWCTSDGSRIHCATSPPAEIDPEVGAMTASRWCTSDGSQINCQRFEPTFECVKKSSPTSTGTHQSDDCDPGYLLTGGGVFCNTAGATLTRSSPNSLTRAWEGGCDTGNSIIHAICCRLYIP